MNTYTRTTTTNNNDNENCNKANRTRASVRRGHDCIICEHTKCIHNVGHKLNRIQTSVIIALYNLLEKQKARTWA